MYILLVYKKELLKNDYLKTLLITIVKSLKKKKKKKTYLKIIWTDKKSYYLNSGLRTFRCNVSVRYIGCSSLSPGSSETGARLIVEWQRIPSSLSKIWL